MDDNPWRDESLLRKLYDEKGLSQYEIADEFGCTQVTVSNAMEDFNIEINRESYPKLYDEEWLEDQYWGEMLSIREIAKKVGCAYATVRRWLDNHDIEKRKTSKEKPPYFQTTTQGYETVSSRCGGKLKAVSVHQLLAIAEGVDANTVFSGGEYHIHHKNGIPWDNRYCNIDVMTKSEHGEHHHG
jgi:hypothetical protein